MLSIIVLFIYFLWRLTRQYNTDRFGKHNQSQEFILLTFLAAMSSSSFPSSVLSNRARSSSRALIIAFSCPSSECSLSAES